MKRTPAGSRRTVGDVTRRRRSRKKPGCNEDEAFIETATLYMAVAAYMEKRQVRWDPVAQDVV